MVVDTSATPVRPASANSILLTSREAVLTSELIRPVKISYEIIIPKAGEFRFSIDNVNQLLKSYRTGIAFNFCILQGIMNSGIFFLSISFLTLAAYIFRTQREQKIAFFLKLSCFAATPVFLGVNLFSLGGVEVGQWWYLFLMVSVFILFRGVRSSQDVT
jgi:hypothetical protein